MLEDAKPLFSQYKLDRNGFPILTIEESQAIWQRALAHEWPRQQYEHRWGQRAALMAERCREAARAGNEKAFLAAQKELSWEIWLRQPNTDKKDFSLGKAEANVREGELTDSVTG